MYLYLYILSLDNLLIINNNCLLTIQTQEELHKVYKEINDLHKTLEVKDNALKLAESRLENRTNRYCYILYINIKAHYILHYISLILFCFYSNFKSLILTDQEWVRFLFFLCVCLVFGLKNITCCLLIYIIYRTCVGQRI